MVLSEKPATAFKDEITNNTPRVESRTRVFALEFYLVQRGYSLRKGTLDSPI